MNRTVAGWVTAVVGVVLFVGGIPPGQVFRTAGIVVCIAGTGLVMSSHLDRGRTPTVGWPTTSSVRSAVEDEGRHARRITTGWVILRPVLIYGSMLTAACGSAAARARDAAVRSVGRAANARTHGPVLYGAAAAIAVASLLFIVGQPTVDPDSGRPSIATQAKPMPSSEPVVTPTVTASPTPTTDGPQRAEFGAVPSAVEGETAAPNLPGAAGPPGAPDEPRVEPSGPPDESPGPDPDITPTPEPAPTVTPSPTSTPKPIPPPPDEDGECLLYVALPQLLELCLLGRL